MRLGFLLRELEQVERAFDIHLVRRDRRELGSCRQQRREMEDQFDLKLRKDPIEQIAIEDRSGDLPIDARGDGWIEAGQIERDDRTVRVDETLDETMSDLAASAGNQHDRFTHGDELYLTT